MELFDQILHIGKGIRNITRLQGRQFHIGILAESLFQRSNVVDQFGRAVATGIVDSPR